MSCAGNLKLSQTLFTTYVWTRIIVRDDLMINSNCLGLNNINNVYLHKVKCVSKKNYVFIKAR